MVFSSLGQDFYSFTDVMIIWNLHQNQGQEASFPHFHSEIQQHTLASYHWL